MKKSTLISVLENASTEDITLQQLIDLGSAIEALQKKKYDDPIYKQVIKRSGHRHCIDYPKFKGVGVNMGLESYELFEAWHEAINDRFLVKASSNNNFSILWD